MNRSHVCVLFAAVCLFSLNACARKPPVSPVSEAVAPAAPQPAVPVESVSPAETPAPSAPDASELAKTNRTTTAVLKLEKVFFEYDSYTLTPQARVILIRNAEQLRDNPAARLTIEGHCDDRGSDEYNLALGQRRAEAVVNYLTTLGVAADRLNVISYGEERPAASGEDEGAWQQNRRAEFM